MVGLLFAADTVRPAASAAVSALARRGIDVLVASGDRKEAVWAAAAAAGVPMESTRWATTPGEMEACGELWCWYGLSYRQRFAPVGVSFVFWPARQDAIKVGSS